MLRSTISPGQNSNSCIFPNWNLTRLGLGMSRALPQDPRPPFGKYFVLFYITPDPREGTPVQTGFASLALRQHNYLYKLRCRFYKGPRGTQWEHGSVATCALLPQQSFASAFCLPEFIRRLGDW